MQQIPMQLIQNATNPFAINQIANNPITITPSTTNLTTGNNHNATRLLI
jgi:hypothetical protein